MDMDLLVGPVELWSYGEMLVVLALTKDIFDLALAAVGQEDILGGPLVTVGDYDSFSEDLCV